MAILDLSDSPICGSSATAPETGMTAWTLLFMLMLVPQKTAFQHAGFRKKSFPGFSPAKDNKPLKDDEFNNDERWDRKIRSLALKKKGQ